MDTASKRAFYLGRYNCIEPLGEGPLGETFRAKIYGVAGFEKQFAVKRLAPRLCDDEELVARFVSAATAYAGLDHERIARVHEVNVQGAQYYLAIDLVRGLDLGKLIELLRSRGEALPTDVALLITLDVAEALESAHARRDLLPGGVLHLGLAPHAVMVTLEGDVRLLDVGLLGALVRLGWADDDSLLPTLAYLPPELLRAEPVDPRCDVFSLGALLYELLSGRRAFPGERAREVRNLIEAAPPAPPAADGKLQAFLTRALAADPAARPPSMSAVREALAPLLGSRGQRARHELGAIARRLARPATRTGAFPVVAMPSAPPPPPVSPPDRRWQPPLLRSPHVRVETAPEAATKPADAPAPSPPTPPATSPPPPPTFTPTPPPPPPPIGPQLSAVPPHNTFAGVGADDQVLVPIELVELPGTPTTPEMAVVPPDPPQAAVDPLDDMPTAPVPKNAPQGSEAAPPPAPEMVELQRDIPRPEQPPERSSPFLRLGIFTALIVGVSGIAIYAVQPKGETAAPAIADQTEGPTVPISRPPAPTPTTTTPTIATPTTTTPTTTTPTTTTPTTATPTIATPTTAIPTTATPTNTTPTTAATPGLDLTTTPAGAMLFVDGEPRGVTPLHLVLAPGRHHVIALADGFLMKRETVEVPAAAPLAWTLTPARLPAELAGDAGLKVRCKTQGELRIFVDGADTGRQCPNEERISVTPGPHRIGLFSPRTGKTAELEHEVQEANYSTRVYTRY